MFLLVCCSDGYMMMIWPIGYSGTYRIPELFWNKICTSIRNYFSQKSILCKYYFTHLIKISSESIHEFHNWEFALVIYNKQVSLLFNINMSTSSFLWLVWYVMLYQFVFWFCCLKFKTYWAILHGIFNISINVEPLYGFSSQ